MKLRSYKLFDGRFRTIIALGTMKHIVDLVAYELHLGDEKIFQRLYNLMNARALHYTYDRGSILLFVSHYYSKA